MPFASNVSAMVTSRTHSFHVGGDGVSNHTAQCTVAKPRMQVRCLAPDTCCPLSLYCAQALFFSVLSTALGY